MSFVRFTGVRKNIHASFSTITKTKSTFEMIDKRADVFVQKIIDSGGPEVSFDIENLSVNFAIDVISSTIFSLNTNCILDPENCKFKRISSIMFVNNNKQWLRKQIENFAPFLSKKFKIFRLSIVPDEVRAFFCELARDLPPTSIFAKKPEGTSENRKIFFYRDRFD